MTTSQTTSQVAPLVISNVIVHEQHGEKIYTFSLSADHVMSICRVERFGVDPEGVNRLLDEKHAFEIAEAFLDHSLTWLEPILGDLSGNGWVFDEEKKELRRNADDFISIDDGQHRWHALGLCNAMERQHLSFTVTVTKGLSFERRLKVFRMQSKRKPVDSRLDLAQRHRLDDWKHPQDREAYELVLHLNSDTTSPLRGMILLDEQEKRPHEGRHRPSGINAKGLHATLKTVIGGKSPLKALSVEKRREVILCLIRLAASVWSKEWKSDQHILTTARGVNAILQLVVTSPNFRGAIGDNFTQESLRRGLNLAKSFKWNAGLFKNVSVREIVSRLDQSIGRNNKAVAA
jgi:hypothetical protein